MVQFAFHQEVKEEAGSDVVREIAVQINGPEQGMGAWRCWVWEGDEIDGDVADDSLLIEDVSDAFANCHHVHIGKRLLRIKAAGVHVSSSSKAVH